MFCFRKRRKKVTDQLCRATGFNLQQLTSFLSDGRKNYIVHKVRTKHKYRLIYEPSAQLKVLQRVVTKLFFSSYPVSKSATAYEKKCSPQANATRHKNARFLAHFDISQFFQSISYFHFQRLLEKKYEEGDIKLLWQVCSLDESLPVGAPSSPLIANRMMYLFDESIAKKFSRLSYTRYSDDLVFSSTKSLPVDLENFLRGELHQMRMVLNTRKTYKFSEKSHKKVTGIVINLNGQLSVGKRYKKKVKKLLYRFRKDRSLASTIKGHLNYIKTIEPGYYRTLARKYPDCFSR